MSWLPNGDSISNRAPTATECDVGRLTSKDDDDRWISLGSACHCDCFSACMPARGAFTSAVGR